jgi:hypothetical protein
VKKIPDSYDVGPQDRAFLLFKEVAVLRNATAWATSYHLQMKCNSVGHFKPSPNEINNSHCDICIKKENCGQSK